MKFPLGAMTLGDVLDRALKLMLGRLPLFLGINALMCVPLFAFQLAIQFLVSFDEATLIAGFIVAYLLWVLSSALIVPLANAATLTVAINEYLDRPSDLKSAIQTGLQHLPTLIGTGIVTTMLTSFGFVLCVPGLYMIATFFVTSQIVVAESKTVMPAISRSSQLVHGHRWRALGLFCVVFIVTRVAVAVVGSTVGHFFPMHEVVPTTEGARIIAHPANSVIVGMATFPVEVVFAAYMSICATLFYLDLRIRKEGLDLQIAAEQMKAEGGGS